MLSDLPGLIQTLSWLLIVFFSNAVQLTFRMFKNCSARFVFRLFKCCPTCRNCSTAPRKLRVVKLFSSHLPELFIGSQETESCQIVQLPLSFRLFKCCPSCRNCSSVPRKLRVVKLFSSLCLLDRSNAVRPAGTVQRLPGNWELSNCSAPLCV